VGEVASSIEGRRIQGELSMTNRKNFYVSGLALAGAVTAMTLTNGGCSAVNNAQNAINGAAQGCSGLDLTSQAQATVKSFADTVGAINTAATTVEAEWLHVCNELNAQLMLDTSKTTAADACAVLHTYISGDLDAGVMLTLTVSPPSCQADLSVQGSCEAQCKASANCDVSANCTGGDVVVGCNGTCSAQCDVTAPSFMCSGTCKGECTASAAVSCTGECTGTCTAPMWTGSCDAGCSASFTGTCGGNCTGTCDGTSMSGAACKGKCVGTCDAKASGSCMAMCTGTYSGGTCTGMCTGKCNVAAGAMCSGTCNGTCSYTPGSATCMGECHGMCSAAVTPPTCTGMLNCSGSAECHGDCQAQAQASLNCSPPQVAFDVEGDASLYTAFQANLADIGKAFNDTIELKDLISPIASKTAATFSAIGDIGVAGASCVASEISVAGMVQASVSVSVSASATVSGS
jgi:hypothetical protein